MRIRLLAVLLLWCMVAPVAALEIIAVVPSTATPGTVITLSGGPFLAGDSVLIGDRRLPAVITPTRLTFTLPALASGVYALAVERGRARTPHNLQLRVVQPPPRIDHLSPVTLDSCTAASERQVTVSGSNFRPDSNLLVDNTAIVVDKSSPSEIVFTLPAVQSGLHQVQVVNPNDQRSLPHALFLSSTPELIAVQSGDDHVINYELILTGKNFRVDSQLTVNGAPVWKSPGKASADGSVREMMRFVDCNTIIYVRRPFLRDPQELSLQIINPGGEQSNVYQLTTP